MKGDNTGSLAIERKRNSAWQAFMDRRDAVAELAKVGPLTWDRTDLELVHGLVLFVDGELEYRAAEIARLEAAIGGER